MKHVLIVTLPDSEPEQFVLKGNRIGLGRGAENEICLKLNEVSSNHLEFRKSGDDYEVEDLDSTNGTKVNGKQVQITRLEDGDRLMIGLAVPAHFLILAEGETWEGGVEAGSKEDQEFASEYASMSDRLEKLEADIGEKEEEAARLNVQLAELQKNYRKNLSEYGEARLNLEKLEAEFEQKKKLGSLSADQMKELEDSLYEKTQRVQVMASNLDVKKKEITELESKGSLQVPQLKKPGLKSPAPKPAVKTSLPKKVSGKRTMRLQKKSGSAAPAPVIRKKGPGN